MIYEKSERVQHNTYESIPHLIMDALETLQNEDLYIDQVHIIADKYMTEKLIKIICRAQLDDFTFDLSIIDFSIDEDLVDDYRTTILDTGEVYIEPAIDKDANYYDCEGFIFAEADVSPDAYNGNNRGNNTMVFKIENEELD